MRRYIKSMLERRKSMRTALTIAGSDSSGGAGIQADIKTMTLNGVFAMSAVTALTAQNTTGVTDIMEATPEFLGEQLDAVFTDIYPDAVKIGMVSSAGLIELIAKKLRDYGAKHIVVDPVMVATSGAKLLRDDAIETLLMSLFYEGRFHTFHPKTYLSRTGITAIRPLCYLPEYHVRHMVEELNLPVVKSPCPANGETKRQEMKELMQALRKRYPDAPDRFLHALQSDKQYDLWQKE